jgi:ER degradation enhancer, mannosidase alpha-like 2
MQKVLLSLSLFIISLGSFAQKQSPKFTEGMKAEMRQKVIAAVRHGWQGYKQYAWGFDDLRPLTKEGRNWYKKSVLMTPVDAFDTFVLLGMKDEAKEAKDLILSKLDFNVDQDVQVFEITIRLLGGLITAYQLDGDNRFLVLAEDLANRLMPCFNTPTGIPYRYVNLVTGKTRDSINNPAEVGTLMMEFGELSNLLNNAGYYATAKKAILAVYKKRSKIDLVGERIDAITGKWVSTESHISGYIDSYYEYLYKSWKLFGDKDFKKAWDVSASAIKKYLIRKQPDGWFCTHVDMNTGKETQPLYGALDAFIAALITYSGDITTGEQMQKANYYMWSQYGMEPEEFNFKTGIITDSSYSLRPENLESCFYLYRATKNDKYLFEGKRIADDIIEHCKTDVGFTSLKNIFTFEKGNYMHSFLYAETFKYAYLIFAPDNAVDLKKVVFNTEAHPLRIIR